MKSNQNKPAAELHICFLAPPFFSHLRPMLQLAAALREKSLRVTVACAPFFKKEILAARCRFEELYINRNANSGSANETEQADEEKQRLMEFFEASTQGAVETLAIQMRHRRRDMFANPDEVLDGIIRLQQNIGPDLWVVDQLSYSVTLSMRALELPFVSFCPPHPGTIPQKGSVYGMPLCWPQRLQPGPQEIAELKLYARSAEKDFDRAATEFLQRRGYPKEVVTHTFSLTSPRAVIFNYPDFGDNENSVSPQRIFMGYSFSQEILDERWAALLKGRERIIYIGLGTFLAQRSDVLRKLILHLREIVPAALLIVAAGVSKEALQALENENTVIEDFVPQKALLPRVGCVVHHGGVGSFTESLYFGKPAVVLPFSSDQFNVACDVERQGLGVVLDPNRFTKSDLKGALEKIEGGLLRENLAHWSKHMRARGPEYAADALVRLLTAGHLRAPGEKKKEE
ncbi:MAG: glycosyltransferase [Spirochaetia bacterium]|nr:glycosyltransferase [Spirochaetia bacterium]